jgi:hypothetical protein
VQLERKAAAMKYLSITVLQIVAATGHGSASGRMDVNGAGGCPSIRPQALF